MVSSGRGSAPQSGAPSAGSLAVTWLGHATTLIELDGVRVLTDPILRNRVGPLRRVAARVDHAALQGLDAVLISHLHADHTDPASLRMLGAPRLLAPRGARRWLARRGIGDVEELAPGEHTELAGLTVRATPAVHDRRRWPLGVSAQPIGAVLKGSGSCYFAGDTDLYPAMGELAGAIDLALLPVWGWGSDVGPGHLDPARAASAVRLIAPRVVVPVHWGTLALAWRVRHEADAALPPRRFSELVRRVAPEVEVRVLAPGERTELVSRSRSAGEIEPS